MHKVNGFLTQCHSAITICSQYLSWETKLAPLASQVFQAWLAFAYRSRFECAQSSCLPNLKGHRWRNRHLFVGSVSVFETCHSNLPSNFSRCDWQTRVGPDSLGYSQESLLDHLALNLCSLWCWFDLSPFQLQATRRSQTLPKQLWHTHTELGLRKLDFYIGMQLLVIVPKNCLPVSITYYRNFVDIFGIYRENVMYYLSIHAYYRNV